MSYKVLMVQERGRHAENVMFRESENFRRAFARLGVESEVWGLGQPTFDRPFDEVVRDYDVVFVIENYDQQGWLPDFAAIKGKTKVFWSIDSHCAIGKHVFFAKRSKFDIHLNSTPGYLKNFEPFSGKCVWFPNAYPSDLIDKRPDVAKTYPAGFCGSMIGDRASWLADADTVVPVKRDVFVLGESMVKCLNTYTVGLNKSIGDDINYRVFETLGAGTALLTNHVPGIERLFECDGRHLLTYQGNDDMKHKLRHLLDHPDTCREMASAGYKHVREHHTYDTRARELLSILNGEIR